MLTTCITIFWCSYIQVNAIIYTLIVKTIKMYNDNNINIITELKRRKNIMWSLFEVSTCDGAGFRAGLRASLHSLGIHLHGRLKVSVNLRHLVLDWEVRNYTPEKKTFFTKLLKALCHNNHNIYSYVWGGPITPLWLKEVDWGWSVAWQLIDWELIPITAAVHAVRSHPLAIYSQHSDLKERATFNFPKVDGCIIHTG